MNNIVNFPNTEAYKRWNTLSKEHQTRIIESVWCSSCSATTKLISADFQIDKQDILIRGCSNKCNGKVARLVEMS